MNFWWCLLLAQTTCEGPQPRIGTHSATVGMAWGRSRTDLGHVPACEMVVGCIGRTGLLMGRRDTAMVLQYSIPSWSICHMYPPPLPPSFKLDDQFRSSIQWEAASSQPPDGILRSPTTYVRIYVLSRKATKSQTRRQLAIRAEIPYPPILRLISDLFASCKGQGICR